MAVGIAACLLLGGLFLYLAARQYRRRARWRGAVRLLAGVKSVRYQEARQQKTEINDHRSSTEATLCFTDRGRAYEERRQYPGIILAPVPGQKLPILFDRDSREWILRKEARTHWCVFAALGCLCTAAGIALLLDGWGILAALTAYRVEAPNLAGSTACALIGLACGACAYACVRGLMPSLLRTAAEPVVWLLKARVLHRFEEVDAQCVGIIWRETGEAQFRSFGLSGIMAFNLSRRVTAGDTIRLNFTPEIDEQTLAELLVKRFGPNGGHGSSWLDGVLPPALGNALIEYARSCSSRSKSLVENVAYLCTHCDFNVTGLADIERAQVTRGGLSLTSFDPETLEAKSRPGVFAAGEALDQDADCGGYNLAWAWLTGVRAGASAARAAVAAKPSVADTSHT